MKSSVLMRRLSLDKLIKPMLICVGVCILALSHATAGQKPNILFIFTDDWGWGDLSCHDHPYIKTPNIDRIAKEGTDFQRFTVASGVCSPSRTAVMTGHFPARYNIDGHFAWPNDNANRGMPDWLSPKAPLLPRMLQEAGYMTAHYGKWHLANDMIPDSPLPGDYGYDDYGAYNCAGEQMPVHDDVARSISFIQKAKQQGKPFFINLWMHEPHTPFHVLPKYRHWFPDLEEADNIYAATLAHADDRIGELLKTLDDLELAENTLVIFSSDNGPARAVGNKAPKLFYDTATGAGYDTGAAKGVTGGRKAYKGALLEGGIGVPFLARWPGKIPAGTIDEVSLISAVDLLPTFCELAGAKLPEGYKPDGLSIVSVLKGKALPSREKPLFWKINAPWPADKQRPDHWVSYAVVHEKWKLVTNKDGSYLELYDIAADPYEKEDLKGARPDVVTSMQATLAGWKKQLPGKPDESCFSKHRN